jgi:uncharacterized membrane protein YhaH (DUF805 family)
MRPRTLLLALLATFAFMWYVSEPTTSQSGAIRMAPGNPNPVPLILLGVAAVLIMWPWIALQVRRKKE